MRFRHLVYTVPLRLRSLFRRGRVEQDLDDEIRYHIERRIEEEIARGASPEQARWAALRAMDGLDQLKEECRDMRRTQFIEQLLRDFRYAWRSLLKSPAFAAVTLLSLALGIGANTAMFSFVDKLLLESLPVERPRELVILNPEGIRNGWVACQTCWSYPSYVGLRDQQQVFSGLLAALTETVNFNIGGATQRVTESIVSGNYFEVLGVRALVGRVLSREDDRVRGGHPVAVVTHGFWVEQLGSRPDIIGQTIRLNGYPFTVVGITERGFNGLNVGGSVDVIVPAAMLPQVVTYTSALDTRSAHIFNLYGRLKPGMTRAQAEAQLRPLYLAQLEQDVAGMSTPPSNGRWKQGAVVLEDGHRGTSGLRGSLETPLTALMAMTGVVLLIACANIAGLLMARSASRTKEISIRLAIGASRGRIVRQLLTESAMLAVLGGLAGLLVAWWTINLLLAETGDAARLQLVTSFLDTRVLGFAFAVSVVTGVLFGLLPALHASRESLSATLKTGAAADRGRQVRLRKMLVTAQVAMGLMLVTAAGLFLRTLTNLRHTDAGFRTERLLQFNLNAGLAGYDRSRAVVLFDQILNDLRALPGVSSATLAVAPLLSGSTIGFGALDLEGYTAPEGEGVSANGDAVAAGYFPTLGMTLVHGRDFTAADTENSPRVAIVNEAFVKEYLAGRDPLGHKIGLGWGQDTRFFHEIIGVVKDARIANLRNEPQRNFFMPYTQWNVLTYANFFVRTTADPASLAAPVRDVIKRHNADIPVVNLRTVDEQIDRLLRPERMVASLSLVFGLLATGLAAIGLYGVTAFSVARRTREIGIRIALGAQRAAVLRMVLRDVAAMAAVGIAVGVALSMGLAKYVESQLYGVAARDMLTIAAAATVLAAVALASGWLPARRASRVDPVRALRQE